MNLKTNKRNWEKALIHCVIISKVKIPWNIEKN